MSFEKEIKSLVKYLVRDAVGRSSYYKMKSVRDIFVDELFKKKRENYHDKYREKYHYSKKDSLPEKKDYKKVAGLSPSRYSGLPSLVLGVGGLIFTGVAAFVLAIVSLFDSFPAIGVLAAVDLTALVLFALLTAYGVGTLRLSYRVRRLLAILQDKNICPVSEVAEITGQTSAAVIKDLRQATKKMLLSGVRLDETETTLLYGKDAYDEYLRYKRNQLEKAAAEEERRGSLGGVDPADLENFKALGVDALRKIRAANDDLTEEDISEKLYKLEDIIGKIFSYVESHPKKLPLTRKFTEYYLPTTLKLTAKYSHFDKSEAENVKSVQLDIKNTFDTVYKAFSNLLDQLTEEDVLDVSTDIKVLETMLAREGLAGDEFEIGKTEGYR